MSIDLTNESLGQFDIAVVRFKDLNQNNRIGSLVVNPGCPGVSDVGYALSAQNIVNTDVLGRYDIVGIEPSGVVHSIPRTCLSASVQEASLASDPKLESKTEYVQAPNETQDLIDKCITKTSDSTHY